MGFMRIIFDYAAFTMQAKGGVSRCMYDLFRHLASSETNEVRLFAGLHRNRYLRQAPPGLKKKIIGFYMPDRFFKQTLFMPLNRFFFQIYVRIYSPNICHYTYFDAPKTPKRCKNVATVHDMIHEKFPQYFGDNNPQTAWKQKTFKQAHGIICVSRNSKRDLLHFFPELSQTIKVIHNGVQISAIHSYSYKKDFPFFLYVGNRSVVYKNFDTVLKAFSEIRKFWPGKLICFGGGRLNTSERKQIAEMGFKGQVMQTSGDDDMLVSLYKQAFTLVYPSAYEGFGLPPVEAMSLGCPVISSNSSPMPEILGDACLYFKFDCPAELTNQFRVLLESDIRNDLIKKGLDQAKRYRWDDIAKETLNFYDKLVSK